MDSGNWVPIDKSLVSALPIGGRPYTELEAMFSLSVNYDNGSKVSVSGLSKSWGWSRRKTSDFLARIGVEVTGSCKGSHLGGEIKPHGHEGLHEADMKRTSGGHFKFNKNGDLQDKKNMTRTSGGHEADMKGSTIIEPNTRTSNKEKKSKPKKERFDFRGALLKSGVSEETADVWMEVRRKKRLTNSKLAFQQTEKQITMSGMSWEEAVKIAAARSWGGIEAKWLQNSRPQQLPLISGGGGKWLTASKR